MSPARTPDPSDISQRMFNVNVLGRFNKGLDRQTGAARWYPFGRGIETLVNMWGIYNVGARQNPAETAADPRIIGGLQTIVDACSPDGGYVIGYEAMDTAATAFALKRIAITTKMFDANYYTPNAIGEAFAVAAGMTCHEVSHIRYGQHTFEAVLTKYEKDPELEVALRVSNILDDRRIEARFGDDFPGYATTFPFVLDWLVRVYPHPIFDVPKDVNEALNLLTAGARYRTLVKFQPGKAQIMAEWAEHWAMAYSADDTVALHLAGVAEALDKLREWLNTTTLDQPKKRPGDGPGNDPGQGPLVIDPSKEPEWGNLDKVAGADDRGKEAQALLERKAKEILMTGDALNNCNLPLHRIGTYARSAKRMVGPGVPEDASILREAFNSTRYTPSEWEPGHALGKLRSRDAVKAAQGSLDVFSRRDQHGDTNVHLVLCIDFSSSMAGYPAAKADRLTKAIVEAMEPVTAFRMTVYHYNSVGVYRTWTDDGADLEEALIHGLQPGGGTPTAEALDLVCSEEYSNIRPRERLMVLSITDGETSVADVKRVVDYFRERGMAVLGVNVDASAVNAFGPSAKRIVEQYGEGALQFDGNMIHLAEDLIVLVGDALREATVG